MTLLASDINLELSTLDDVCPDIDACLWILGSELIEFKGRYELWGYHLLDEHAPGSSGDFDPDLRYPLGVDWTKSFGFEIMVLVIFMAAFAYFRKMKARIEYLSDMDHEQDIKWMIAQDWEGAARKKQREREEAKRLEKVADEQALEADASKDEEKGKVGAGGQSG